VSTAARKEFMKIGIDNVEKGLFWENIVLQASKTPLCKCKHCNTTIYMNRITQTDSPGGT